MPCRPATPSWKGVLVPAPRPSAGAPAHGLERPWPPCQPFAPECQAVRAVSPVPSPVPYEPAAGVLACRRTRCRASFGPLEAIHGSASSRQARPDHRCVKGHRCRRGARVRGSGLPPDDRGPRCRGAGAPRPAAAHRMRRGSGDARRGPALRGRHRAPCRRRARPRRAGQQRRRRCARIAREGGRSRLAPRLGAEGVRLHQPDAAHLRRDEGARPEASSSTTSVQPGNASISTASPPAPAMRH